MSHSGGGGSHSGGSHGGSSRSRGRGGSSYRISSRPFRGCRTFVVYKHDKPSRIVYSDKNFDAKVSLGFVIFNTIFLGIFAIIGFCALLGGILSLFRFKLHKIVPPANTEICIFDSQNLVDDSDEKVLIQSLQKFYNATGIVPAVEFTTDAMWQDNYVSAEKYAYNEYVKSFFDEKHVLILYSYGYSDYNTNFNEFHWESMWGDDVSRAVSASDEKKLKNIMQKNLTRANGNKVASAISDSFDEFTDEISAEGFRFAKENIPENCILIIWGLIFGIFPLSSISTTIKSYILGRGTKTYEVLNGMLQKNCEYCGCMYIVGTISVCPHCGAAIPAYSSQSIE